MNLYKGGLNLETNNYKDGFFAKVFNIQDKKIPKFSLYFFLTLIFEFLVALPVFYFLSKDIGAILLYAVLIEFLLMDIYIIIKVVKYFLNKNI